MCIINYAGILPRKSEALSHLRRSKQLEAELNRKLQQMANLENLEMKIGVAKDNQTVIRAMSVAGSALKQATGGAEGLAEAERTMDDVAELIDDTNMVSVTNDLYSTPSAKNQLPCPTRDANSFPTITNFPGA